MSNTVMNRRSFIKTAGAASAATALMSVSAAKADEAPAAGKHSWEVKPEPITDIAEEIDTEVLIIGGGDTGNDCGGTVIRQGAVSVMSIDLMPKPPVVRSPNTPWPMWPYRLRGSSSVDEGLQRFWSLNTLRFLGDNGQVAGVEVVPVKWAFEANGRPTKFEVSGPSQVIPCDLVVLAMGFLKRTRQEVLDSLGLPDQDNVLIAGDAANGPSLVVRAIADGLKCAQSLA